MANTSTMCPNDGTCENDTAVGILKYLFDTNFIDSFIKEGTDHPAMVQLSNSTTITANSAGALMSDMVSNVATVSLMVAIIILVFMTVNWLFNSTNDGEMKGFAKGASVMGTIGRPLYSVLLLLPTPSGYPLITILTMFIVLNSNGIANKAYNSFSDKSLSVSKLLDLPSNQAFIDSTHLYDAVLFGGLHGFCTTSAIQKVETEAHGKLAMDLDGNYGSFSFALMDGGKKEGGWLFGIGGKMGAEGPICGRIDVEIPSITGAGTVPNGEWNVSLGADTNGNLRSLRSFAESIGGVKAEIIKIRLYYNLAAYYEAFLLAGGSEREPVVAEIKNKLNELQASIRTPVQPVITLNQPGWAQASTAPTNGANGGAPTNSNNGQGMVGSSASLSQLKSIERRHSAGLKSSITQYLNSIGLGANSNITTQFAQGERNARSQGWMTAGITRAAMNSVTSSVRGAIFSDPVSFAFSPPEEPTDDTSDGLKEHAANVTGLMKGMVETVSMDQEIANASSAFKSIATGYASASTGRDTTSMVGSGWVVRQLASAENAVASTITGIDFDNGSNIRNNESVSILTRIQNAGEMFLITQASVEIYKILALKGVGATVVLLQAAETTIMGTGTSTSGTQQLVFKSFDYLVKDLLGSVSDFLGNMGAMMAVVIPNLPYVLIIFAAIGWILQIVMTIFGMPLLLIMHSLPQQSFIGSQQQAYITMVSLFFRPLLIVVGFFLAFILYEPLVAYLSKAFFATKMSLAGSQSSTSVGEITSYIVTAKIYWYGYGSILIALTYLIFGLVQELSDNVLDWLGTNLLRGFGNVNSEKLMGQFSAGVMAGQRANVLGKIHSSMAEQKKRNQEAANAHMKKAKEDVDINLTPEQKARMSEAEYNSLIMDQAIKNAADTISSPENKRLFGMGNKSGISVVGSDGAVKDPQALAQAGGHHAAYQAAIVSDTIVDEKIKEEKEQKDTETPTLDISAMDSAQHDASTDTSSQVVDNLVAPETGNIMSMNEPKDVSEEGKGFSNEDVVGVSTKPVDTENVVTTGEAVGVASGLTNSASKGTTPLAVSSTDKDNNYKVAHGMNIADVSKDNKVQSVTSTTVPTPEGVKRNGDGSYSISTSSGTVTATADGAISAVTLTDGTTVEVNNDGSVVNGTMADNQVYTANVDNKGDVSAVTMGDTSVTISEGIPTAVQIPEGTINLDAIGQAESFTAANSTEAMPISEAIANNAVSQDTVANAEQSAVTANNVVEFTSQAVSSVNGISAEANDIMANTPVTTTTAVNANGQTTGITATKLDGSVVAIASTAAGGYEVSKVAANGMKTTVQTNQNGEAIGGPNTVSLQKANGDTVKVAQTAQGTQITSNAKGNITEAQIALNGSVTAVSSTTGSGATTTNSNVALSNGQATSVKMNDAKGSSTTIFSSTGGVSSVQLDNNATATFTNNTVTAVQTAQGTFNMGDNGQVESFIATNSSQTVPISEAVANNVVSASEVNKAAQVAGQAATVATYATEVASSAQSFAQEAPQMQQLMQNAIAEAPNTVSTFKNTIETQTETAKKAKMNSSIQIMSGNESSRFDTGFKATSKNTPKASQIPVVQPQTLDLAIHQANNRQRVQNQQMVQPQQPNQAQVQPQAPRREVQNNMGTSEVKSGGIQQTMPPIRSQALQQADKFTSVDQFQSIPYAEQQQWIQQTLNNPNATAQSIALANSLQNKMAAEALNVTNAEAAPVVVQPQLQFKDTTMLPFNSVQSAKNERNKDLLSSRPTTSAGDDETG